MNAIVTREELKEHRDRTSKKREILDSKVGTADDYMCTELKAKSNELSFEKELIKINKEFEL